VWLSESATGQRVPLPRPLRWERLFVFFAGYRFDPALECFAFPHPRPSEYVYFVGFFLARPFATFPTGGHLAQGLAAMLACAAVAICAVVLSGAFRPREDARRFRVAGLLIAFSLLFAGSVAAGRVCAGLDGALTSRYVPYALPFWFAIYLLLRGRSYATSARATAIAAALLVAFVAKDRRSDDEPEHGARVFGAEAALARVLSTPARLARLRRGNRLSHRLLPRRGSEAGVPAETSPECVPGRAVSPRQASFRSPAE
jgi:hypothetical protein